MRNIFSSSSLLLILLAASLGMGTACSQTNDISKVEQRVSITTIAQGLSHPWGIAFLPDGSLLVTERDTGHLRVVNTDGTVSAPVGGTPEVYAEGQGGLLDVAIDPAFAENRLVYVSFSEPANDGKARTAVGRGRLEGEQLRDFQVIFRQQPAIQGSKHFGSRLVFDGNGNLFVTLGERFQFDPAQNLANHLGTVVRIEPDGSIPNSNPFVDKEGAEPEIWSYGHRNIEAAAIHPDTGELWIAEMGPLGGDELNQPDAGENHGWPEVSWGKHYSGFDIPDPSQRPEFASAVKQWTPVISPSGMIFYTGEAFSDWNGNILIGGLSDHSLVRLTMDGNKVLKEDRVPFEARIRDVAQGPGGYVYLLTDEDNGKLLRLGPK
jgi:aldose sugar dehydrogenase